MNLIERILSKALYHDNVFYHSVESASGFFEGACKRVGLEGWSFKIVSSTKKSNIGYCSYARKLIAMQARFFFAMSAEEVEQVILHEIAHALTKGHGHDPVWRAKAVELGVKVAKATTPIASSKGFRKDWMINTGTRSESEFDAVAFTSSELPRSKRPSSPNFGGPEKRVAKPTRLAVNIFNEFRNSDNWLWMDNFKREFINCGYKENYAQIQWDLCRKFD